MHPIHWQSALEGLATSAAIAHAVNTFPTPKNKYGAWLLGVLQYAFGQRVAGVNTMKGMDTEATAVAKGVEEAAQAEKGKETV